MTQDPDTLTLWRPVGPDELALIEAAGRRAFPPRLPEQPIFYPVLNEAYAVQIAFNDAIVGLIKVTAEIR